MLTGVSRSKFCLTYTPFFFGLHSNLDRNFCILDSKLDSKLNYKLDSKLNYKFDFKLYPKSYSKLDFKLDSKFRLWIRL